MTKRKTGLEQYYILKNNKKLHYGYTTGACAAAASKAAAEMLLSGHKVQEVETYDSERHSTLPWDRRDFYGKRKGFLCSQKRWRR